MQEPEWYAIENVFMFVQQLGICRIKLKWNSQHRLLKWMTGCFFYKQKSFQKLPASILNSIVIAQYVASQALTVHGEGDPA